MTMSILSARISSAKQTLYSKSKRTIDFIQSFFQTSCWEHLFWFFNSPDFAPNHFLKHPQLTFNPSLSTINYTFTFTFTSYNALTMEVSKVTPCWIVVCSQFLMLRPIKYIGVPWIWIVEDVDYQMCWSIQLPACPHWQQLMHLFPCQDYCVCKLCSFTQNPLPWIQLQYGGWWTPCIMSLCYDIIFGAECLEKGGFHRDYDNNCVHWMDCDISLLDTTENFSHIYYYSLNTTWSWRQLSRWCLHQLFCNTHPWCQIWTS